jgi:ribosomal protein S18 acetylase RimI-like enzyme
VTREDGLVRDATAADAGRIVDIMYSDPPQEAVALLGSVERARRFGAGLIEMQGVANPARPTRIAARDGEIVGVLQYTRGAPHDDTLALVRLVFKTCGVLDTLRGLPRAYARSKVEPKIPARAFHIAEVHVDPACRGQGIGGTLLDDADAEARRTDATHMTLTTTTVNPARRLYERHGFQVIQTLTNARYERYTGIAGRILMEKVL